MFFGFLILGLVFSGVSVMVNFVNSIVNGIVMVLLELIFEKKFGDEVWLQFGGVIVVVEFFIEVFVFGVGWVVVVGSFVVLIVKYLYLKFVSEFIEGFVSEILDRIIYNGQEFVKGVKINFWGMEVEIGYGYVKKKWGGLKKEIVIVKLVIIIIRDEVKVVEDLFSLKEYGKFLV